jgi:AcrR family transcriptional regulator
MRDLARASGVSDATLYNLFTTKGRLVMAAVADLLEGITERVQQPDQSHGLSAIIRYSDSICAQILQNPAYALAMSRALFRSEPDSPIVEVLLDSNRRFLSKELYAAKRAGELNSGVEVASSATILSGQTWGVLLMWNKDLLDLEGLPKMMRQSLEMSLSSLASRKGREFIKANR